MVIVRRQIMIGDKLLQTGIITQEQLDKALEEQRTTKEKIGEVLVRLGLIKAEELLPILAEHVGVGYSRINLDETDKEALELIPEDMMRKCMVFPLKKNGNKLTLAMADPMNAFMIDELQLSAKCTIKPVLALKSEIENAINTVMNKDDSGAKESEILSELDSFSGGDDFDMVEGAENIEDGMGADSAPVVKAVSAIISGALKSGASDIHIEPYEKRVRVRYRIDGVMKEISSLPKKISNALSSRVKIMSDLDIAEKRLPQDGRFRIKKDGRDIDFRVSVLPTVQGEKAVMRILDKGNLKLDMKDLGFEEIELERFDKALSQPYGMILVTGPTGSGKSTTLYSALNKVNDVDINISTAEDPVEFQMEGINQVHCKPEIGLDFAAALKSFLRQDPDVIMVGEIRDYETAAIAIKAALTGHLVLSTLHTNDAPGTISRLINMGIEPFMIASSLLLVEAQRLGRRICKSCKSEVKADPGILAALNLDVEKYKDQTFYKGKGCPVCSGTGYKGRVGFYEVMLINDALRDAIAKGKNTDEIRKVAKEFAGLRTLREAALEKAMKGVTTLEEVLRNTIDA